MRLLRGRALDHVRCRSIAPLSGKFLAINSTKNEDIRALLKLVLIATAGIHFGNSRLLDLQRVSLDRLLTRLVTIVYGKQVRFNCAFDLHGKIQQRNSLILIEEVARRWDESGEVRKFVVFSLTSTVHYKNLEVECS